jgi:WhiB family redox-sensing transcriptional regulator
MTSMTTRRRDPDNPQKWVQGAKCFPDSPQENVPVSNEALFVAAGHSISDETYAMCVGCPIRIECLEYAYERDFRFGYFGGVSPSVRKRTPLATVIEAITDGRLDRGGRIRPKAQD